MKRQELLDHLYDISEMEKELKLNPKQTDFYDYLDDIGSKEINGVYNIQSSKFLRPIKPQSDYFWDRLHYSPHQNMLTIKKATRFSIELILSLLGMYIMEILK